MRQRSTLASFACLAFAVFAAGACNLVFGIEPGLTGSTGNTGGGNTGGGPTTTTGVTTTTATTSTSTTTTTTSSATTGTGGGAPCSPKSTATCEGAVLHVCDATGHAAAPVTCPVVAACDAAAGACIDPGTFGRLALGDGRGCVIEDDRSVRCWGNNTFGELILDDMHDMVPAATPVAGVSGARQISVCADHQCVLQDGGTVTCWGSNGSGQLGFMPGGVMMPATVPGLQGVVEVRTTPDCSCARLADGTVDCWGLEDHGCLGTAAQKTGTQPSPTPLSGVTGAVQLRTGSFGEPVCIVQASGKVVCWNPDIVPSEVPGVSDAFDVTVGFGLVFIRSTSAGLLTSAPKQDHSGWTGATPYGISGTITAMAAGDSFCGLRTDGVVTCTLLNGGPMPEAPSPVPGQPPGQVVEIAAGSSEGYDLGLQCLRLAGPVANHVYCWGDDGSGALGAGAPEDFTTPQTVANVAGAASLSAAENSTSAVLADGSAVYWGTSFALGTKAATPPLILGFLGTDNVSIQANDFARRAYVIKKSGVPVFFDQTAPMINARLLSSGFTDFIDARTFVHWDVGLRAGGAVVLYAEQTDGNVAGVFGDGTTTATVGEIQSVPAIAPATSPAKALTAYCDAYNSSPAHVCAILGPASTVSCWGENDQGEIGAGTPGTMVLTPTAVALPGNPAVVSIAAGRHFTCAVTSAGKVYCWGANDVGQLGQTVGGSSATPVQVPGVLNAAGVTAREAHACAWLADKTVACWGQNHLGQLGNGTFDPTTGPVVVSGLSNVVQVSAGVDHTCARRGDGTVACWGSSYEGQAGVSVMGAAVQGVFATPQKVLNL